MAGWLAAEMEKIAYEALYEKGPVSDKYEELKKKHNVPGKPFLFQVSHFLSSICMNIIHA